MKNKNHVSISEYAKLCGGISVQAIHARRKNKKISFIKKKWNNDFIFLIDIIKFPPSAGVAGRPAYTSSDTLKSVKN
jgi:hypothetical protein